MTIPNLLTLTRILLTPLLMWFLVHRRLSEALVVFFIAGMTDVLDGFIARLFHQKSKLGAILDPLADKFLLVSSFLILGRIGLIPWWLVIIAVARDGVIVLGTSILFALRFRVEVRPTVLGKLTTLTQLGSVVLALGSSLALAPPLIHDWVFALTAALSVATGVQYVRKGISAVQSRSVESSTER